MSENVSESGGETEGAELLRLAEEHFAWSIVSKEDARSEFPPMIFTRAEGVTITDADGRDYIDLTSSIARASTLGYGDERIADAVREQLVTLHYAGCTIYAADIAIRVAERLARLTPGDLNTAVLVGSGSEANEVAFKIAKLYHQARGLKPRAYKVISRWDAYHGAVGTAAAASDWLGVRRPVEPGVPGVSHIPPPTCFRCPLGLEHPSCNVHCADLLENQILHEGPELVAAFIAEPVMQANGVQIPPDDYFPRIKEICDRHDVLFIADEVITGFGRTGEWFGVEHWGIEPDIMTLAKGITGGYIPMGATIVQREIWEALPQFPDVHTFGGHPAGAAAALAAIERYEDDDLIARARDLGARMLARLEDLERLDIVGQVRGIGMWVAIDFVADESTKDPLPEKDIRSMLMMAREKGVLIGMNGTAIEVAPALTIGDSELDDGLQRTCNVIEEFAAARAAG